MPERVSASKRRLLWPQAPAVIRAEIERLGLANGDPTKRVLLIPLAALGMCARLAVRAWQDSNLRPTA
jgi:hypothetical protein